MLGPLWASHLTAWQHTPTSSMPAQEGGCYHLGHPPAFDAPLHQSLSSVFGWMEPVAVLRPELHERLGE